MKGIFSMLYHASPCYLKSWKWGVTMLPMLSHAFWNHEKMLYHAPHAFPCCLISWQNAVPCSPCFSMLSEIMRECCTMLPMLSHAFWTHENEELPCSPCFPMLSEIMRKCCSMLPMLFHAILNDKKVLSHEFHANPCSAGVTWKIFPCFPCFSMLLHSMEKQGKHGKHGETMVSPWIPCFSPCFLHQGYDVCQKHVKLAWSRGSKDGYDPKWFTLTT